MFGKYTPPEGYEIRTIPGPGSDSAGRYARITPYYQGQPISEGRYPGIAGFGPAVRSARKAIRIHSRYSVDRKAGA